MQVVRRTAVALFFAAVVPLLALGIFYIGSLLQQRQRDAEDRRLDRATAYISRVDGELKADLGALSALASLRLNDAAAIAEARERAIALVKARPLWRKVILTDITNRRFIWQTEAPGAAAAAAGPPAPAGDESAPVIERIDGWNATCRCVRLHRRIGIDGAVYVLTLERDTTDFQALLLQVVAESETAGLVDRAGLFLARTLDIANRRGTPATSFVRAAVAQGGQGVYTGTTYEGLENRSAYVTSDLSGWSVHIAVSSSSYNALLAGRVISAIIAVALALLFAAGVSLYAMRDIANRRRRERARLQTRKLEAIGYLSSAVAHDFNNLLAAMSACLNLLRRSEEPGRRSQIIAEGLAAVDRGGKLVRQLLGFARDKLPTLDCVDLASAVEGIRDLLVRSLGDGIALHVDLARDANYVRTNDTKLELVLLNLAVNARDAMPQGGSFTISSRPSQRAGFVDLMVQDTGIGMSKEVAARALEPFFTTKEDGKGTGLGLAQAQLLMSESGGELLLETAPGKGALFILQLPACHPRAIGAAAA